MALDYKKKKNLIRSPDEYTRYYGNFRGVDFSSEETEVNEQRFAYAVNMYKDYRSSEGNAIETIPGFRRRFETPLEQNARSGTATNEKINGIHEFTYFENNERKSILIVHAGTNLYAWDKEHSVNTIVSMYAEIPKDEPLTISMKDTHCTEVVSIEIPAAKSGILDSGFSYADGILTLQSDVFKSYEGKDAIIRYKELTINKDNAICTSMANAESKSFSFNNRLYILDGECFRVVYRDKDKLVATSVKTDAADTDISDPTKITWGTTYFPTTYSSIPCIETSSSTTPDNSPGNTPEDENPENDSETSTDRYPFQNISEYEYEQENLLNAYYRHSYTAPSSDSFVLPIYSEDAVVAMIGHDIYGKKRTFVEKRDVNSDPSEGVEGFYIVSIKDKGEDTGKKVLRNTGKGVNPDYFAAGVDIVYMKSADKTKEHNMYVDFAKIDKCTNFITFDNRIFLTGNPDYPNLLFYCGNNNETGYIDPTYFGELDYVQDGVEEAPITGLITVADTLAVLKNYAKQDSSIYFHTRMETNEGVAPVTYPSQPGLSGVGCLGACVNFLDDPIFISPLGVEAIGQLSVRLERAVEHRSSLIDAKLTSMDLSKAKFAEWDGYLVLLLPGGKMFLADSRQRYTHSSGVMQYEWYYIEGVGVYEDDDTEYYYALEMDESVPDVVDGYEVALAKNVYNVDTYLAENLINSPVKAEEDEELEVEPLVDGGYLYYVLKPTWDGHSMNEYGYPKTEIKAILCENRGSRTGGIFHEATHIINIDRNLYFGTNNGVICSFNFDLFKDGKLPQYFYSFDGHTINCGVATKLDNCGIPHLAKSTIKKSTVVKTKSMYDSAAKIRVRTNNKGYESVARINSGIFDFEHTDFSSFSFAAEGQTIFAVKEKEKHWVEKQHWIYSDEFERPFAIHYLAFRYKVSGRIKNR